LVGQMAVWAAVHRKDDTWGNLRGLRGLRRPTLLSKNTQERRAEPQRVRDSAKRIDGYRKYTEKTRSKRKHNRETRKIKKRSKESSPSPGVESNTVGKEVEAARRRINESGKPRASWRRLLAIREGRNMWWR